MGDANALGREMSLIRLILLCFGIYTIATASEEDRSLMYQGAQAFSRAAFNACSGPNGICARALDNAHALSSTLAENQRASEYFAGNYLKTDTSRRFLRNQNGQ